MSGAPREASVLGTGQGLATAATGTAASATAATAIAPMAPASAVDVPSRARDTVTLLKLRIGVLATAVVVLGAVAAGAGSAGTLLVLGLAAMAASAGASVLNHVLERESDRLMHRTADRPMSSGRYPVPAALALGLGLSVAPLLALDVLGALPVALLLAGSLTYSVIYTAWLKRRTSMNIVIGGAAGSFALLAGWAVAAPVLAPVPLLLALLLLLWTPTHFWPFAIVHHADYRRGDFPMLPVVVGVERAARVIWLNSLLLVATTMALAWWLGPLYGVVATGAGFVLLRAANRLRAAPSAANGRHLFKLSGPWLLVVMAGVVAATLT